MKRLKEMIILFKDMIKNRQRFYTVMANIKKGNDPHLLAQFIRYKAHSLDLARKRGEREHKNTEKILKNYIHLYESKYGYEYSITWAKNILAAPKGANNENYCKQKIFNSIDEVILERKSIRKFIDKEIENEILYKLIEMGIQAPIACNKQSLRFLIAKKKKGSIKGIQSTKDFGSVEIPPAIIYIINDDRYYFEKETPLMTIGCVAENIALKATTLGIGSCLMHVGHIHRIRLRKLLKLHDYESIYLMIFLGYPNENPIKPYRCAINEIVSII